MSPAERGQYHGMKAERTKRKDAEKLAADLSTKVEAQAAQIQQLIDLAKPQATPQAEAHAAEEPADFWDDPKQFIAKSNEAVGGEIEKLRASLEKQRLNSSEVAAKTRHEDYGENYAAFQSALVNHVNAAATPEARQSAKEDVRAFMQQVTNADDPAEALYQHGARIRSQAEVAEAGGLDALVAKKVAEGIAAANQSAETEEADALVQSATLPKSMTGRRAVGGGASPKETGFDTDQSLGQILGE